MQMFGIVNCDTVKKARTYLEEKKRAYQFHDFKKEPPTQKQIEGWLKHLSWEELLNTHGMTWRKLPETKRVDINQVKAIQLMLEQPSIIKRPIVEVDDRVILGFTESEYSKL